MDLFEALQPISMEEFRSEMEKIFLEDLSGFDDEMIFNIFPREVEVFEGWEAFTEYMKNVLKEKVLFDCSNSDYVLQFIDLSKYTLYLLESGSIFIYVVDEPFGIVVFWHSDIERIRRGLRHFISDWELYD